MAGFLSFTWFSKVSIIYSNVNYDIGLRIVWGVEYPLDPFLFGPFLYYGSCEVCPVVTLDFLWKGECTEPLFKSHHCVFSHVNSVAIVKPEITSTPTRTNFFPPDGCNGPI